MNIGPILSTLRRHKTAASLIILEVALTCAIICNAVFLIAGRIERMQAPTGLAESELVAIEISGIGRGVNADALTQQDLAALRAVPGVTSAAIVNQIPYGNSATVSNVDLAPNQPSSTLDAPMYKLDEGGLQTLGLKLAEGRDFTPDEFQLESALKDVTEIHIPSILLNRDVAAMMFPGQDAVGKVVYLNASPTRVIGLVDRLVGPSPGDARDRYGVVIPVRMSYVDGRYVLRVDPARKAEVLKAAIAALDRVDARRIVVDQSTFDELRSKYYEQDRAMAWLLVAVCVALLVVTAFGIVGLASFWVQQRTRMIGTRRALGASRGHIVRYFQTENFLLTGIGIVIGMIGAYAINQLLMTHYELPRLPWTYLPVGAVVLWCLGQIAVLGPAMRAAALPPMVVMRGA